MKSVLMFLLLLSSSVLFAQRETDATTIRNILKEETSAWNKGDAEGYSRSFAEDGTFTNILGMYYVGHTEFVARHDGIFKGIFRGTNLQQDVVSLKFVGRDVAVVDSLSSVSGFSKEGLPATMHLDGQGRLRTRLLQVFWNDGHGWKIVSYHNVDVKPGMPVPDPK